MFKEDGINGDVDVKEKEKVEAEAKVLHNVIRELEVFYCFIIIFILFIL